MPAGGTGAGGGTNPSALSQGPALGIQGRAYLPEQGLYHKPSRFSGRVTAVAADAPVKQEKRWTLTVTDASGAVQTYLIVLPEAFALPMRVGTSVELRSGLSAGRAAPGVIVITDSAGQLLLAISQVPETWRVEDGAQLSVSKDSSYDSHRHAVVIRTTGGAGTLDESWRQLSLDGVAFYGTGTTTRNVQHPGAVPPPGFLSGWTDFSLIRVATPGP
jgi:hypothetical protein